MIKKNYLLVAMLSFMFISPAFSMGNEDDGSSHISTSQEKDGKPQSPASQEDTKQKTPHEDLKEDSPPAMKPTKKGKRWCCLLRTEDDD